ncbi:MAG: response regulator transcription factor, partial [Lachnospiraceae bacterium]
VFAASNGEMALEIMKQENINLIILDIMMPKMNGYRLIEELRKFSIIPILILSAKDLDQDKILGLNLGADDYLTKPFNPLEVLARVRSHLRRNYELNIQKNQTENKKIQVGELTLDMESFVLYKGDNEIILTPTEYKILKILLQEPGRIFTKVQIMQSINGVYIESDDNTLMVHISKLREKIEMEPKNPQYLKTVRGLGYKIEQIQG